MVGTSWGNLSAKEIKDIIEGAGKKTRWDFSWWFPFISRSTWVFGGHCGICSKWNWQWRMVDSILGATYACVECQR